MFAGSHDAGVGMMNVCVVFPVLFAVLLFLLLLSNKVNNRSPTACAEVLLASLVTTGVTIALATEALSAFNAIGFRGVVFIWLAAAAALLVLLVFSVKRRPGRLGMPVMGPLSMTEIVVVAAMLLLALTLGAIALAVPPSTYDAMTYHLGRIIHWMQNGNLDFYPTNIDRQLSMGPWAEEAIMHLHILSGGDRFANLVQFVAMLGSVVGVSLIAGQLGARRRGRILAAVFCVTLPMGIFQATSTQNDYVLTLWMVAFVHYVLEFRNRASVMNAVAAGVSLGLATLTKSTAFVFAFPFGVWVAVSTVRKGNLKGIVVAGCIPLTVLLLNVPHFARNAELYGSPVGPPVVGKCRYTNEIHSPRAITSNIIRNLALHVRTPWGAFNDWMRSNISAAHRLLDIDLNDSRTTWPRTEFDIGGASFYEDTQGNGLHLLMIGVCVLLLPFLRRRYPAGLLPYFFALCAGALLFSALLKWQPWHSRLHLPLFALFSPLIAVVLTSLSRTGLATSLVGGALLLNAIPWALCNKQKPLVTNCFPGRTREELYFINREGMGKAYIGAADFIHGRPDVSRIGLALGLNHWEYPLLPLLTSRGVAPRFEHVCVANKSRRIHTDKFVPDAIFSTRHGHKPELSLGGSVFTKRWEQGNVSVFLREELRDNIGAPP